MSQHKLNYHTNIQSDDDEKSDVIRCICDDMDDDGFTIQCEECLDWQHASCVNIKRNKIPEHYLCDRCKKKHRKNEIKGKSKYSHDEVDSLKTITKSIIKNKAVEDVYRHHKKQDDDMTMDSSLLLPSIPKVSVRPLQRSLRNASFHTQKDPSVQKGVFADIHIPEDRFLLEVTGEVYLKSDYKHNIQHHYDLLTIPLAHVFFHPTLDLCIDTRQMGNDAYYVRHSCHPNSELRNIIVPNQEQIHLGIYTTEEVSKGEEITIGWDWHKGRVMWKKHQELIKNMPRKDIANLKKIMTLFYKEYGECACEDKEECLLEYLKEELDKPKRKIKHSIKKPKKKKITPPSPAGSDLDISPPQCSLYILPPKKRWLALHRQLEKHGYSSDDSQSTLLTHTKKKLSIQEYLSMRKPSS